MHFVLLVSMSETASHGWLTEWS